MTNQSTNNSATQVYVSQDLTLTIIKGEANDN